MPNDEGNNTHQVNLLLLLLQKKSEIFTSSTLAAVLAEVSINIKPFSFANCSPSSVDTALLCSRSLLLPISYRSHAQHKAKQQRTRS
jgi:hypothetical protein